MSFSRGGRDHGAGNPGSSGAGDAGGGHIGNLKHYFGDVNPQYSKMLAEDKFAHETYNLPKAYEGKNKYLEKVIDYLITNENDWYTSQVLPWVETDDLHLKWEIFRFNKTLMDLEPHQGVPRYVTAEREARSDRLVRRGLAFIIEHGFYTTAEGKQHYLMNLRQIVDSVNETAYHGVVYALLSADNHYKEWHRQHGSRVQRPGDLQRAGKRLWAVVQKQERGLYLLDAELKDTMRYEGVNPDTWIVPSKMSIYVTMVDGPTPLKYSDGGPSTQGALEAGPSRFQTFRGSKVFESRPFDIDFIGEPYDLLVRRRQIGEHFILGGKDSGLTTAGVKQSAKTSSDEGKFDSYIYSMDIDNFERISFREAAAKALSSVATPNMSAEGREDVKRALRAALPAVGDGPQTTATKDAISDAVDMAVSDSVPGALATNGVLIDAILTAAAAASSAPFRVLLVRPFQTYDMASGILLKRGLETGMTAHGHHDFMLSDDVIHKVHIGHYTFYHKSIIKQPKNITIAEDIFARNYVRGEGTSIYNGPGEFQSDAHKDYFQKDLIAMIIPGSDRVTAPAELGSSIEDFAARTGSNAHDDRIGKVTNPLDLSGVYEGTILDEVPTDLQNASEGLYPLSRHYDQSFGFRNIKTFGDNMEKFLNPLRFNNSITWQGMQLEARNSVEGLKFDRVTLNTGHWGPNVYAGAKSVRTGENAFLKDMEYEKVRTSQGLLQ